MNQIYTRITLVNATPMFAIDAQEKGYRVSDCHNHTAGFEVTYEDGYKSWCPADVFLQNAIISNPEYDYQFICDDNIPEFIKRMITELNELREKYISLNTFINGNSFKLLDHKRQHYMKMQLKIMHAYINVLGQRLLIENEDYIKTVKE